MRRSEICEILGVFDVVIGNLEATQSSKVGASAEFFADVFGESTDVGAGANMATNFELWVVVA